MVIRQVKVVLQCLRSSFAEAEHWLYGGYGIIHLRKFSDDCNRDCARFGLGSFLLVLLGCHSLQNVNVRVVRVLQVCHKVVVLVHIEKSQQDIKRACDAQHPLWFLFPCRFLHRVHTF